MIKVRVIAPINYNLSHDAEDKMWPGIINRRCPFHLINIMYNYAVLILSKLYTSLVFYTFFFNFSKNKFFNSFSDTIMTIFYKVFFRKPHAYF